jgi:hypothetical protein
MAERKDSGVERQERIQREQHRPEQNEGYDEAVRQGGPQLPNDSDKVSYLPPEPPDTRGAREQNDIDERETQRAIDEVRRREHSAD